MLDGTGSPAYRADVGVRGDRIVFVGEAAEGTRARKTIEAGGYLVTPGFIDPHTHTERDLNHSVRRANEPYLFQGVTTVIFGNDGGGPIATGATLRRLDSLGTGTNVGVLVGHNSLRRRAMGQEDRPPTQEEMEAMKAWLRKGMEEGALGLSAGLFYSPGHFARTDEVIELARVAAEYDGLYDVHQRDESSYSVGLKKAVEETLRIAQAAGIRTNISHIKALGADVWGQSDTIIQLIEDARRRGLRVTADQYPYRASSTGLAAALLPRWIFADDPDYRPKLSDPDLSERLEEEVASNIRRRGGPESFLLTVPSDETLKGKRLDDIARARDATPVQAALSILRQGDSRIASFNMLEEDIRLFMRQPWVMTGSDGVAGHPRKYGSYSRKIAYYVRQEKILNLEEMVYRSSLLPALTLGLYDRGRIAPGMKADLLVFRPEEVEEHATFEAPSRLSSGMRYVLVNGQPAIWEGKYTGALAGRALPRQARPVQP